MTKVNLTYLFLSFILFSRAQGSLFDPGTIRPSNLYRNVAQFYLKAPQSHLRMALIDSASTNEQSLSKKSYFVIDSIVQNKENKWKYDTVRKFSISTKLILSQLNINDSIKTSLFNFMLLCSELEIVFLDRNIGYIIGGSFCPPRSDKNLSRYRLLRTGDGGKTWAIAELFQNTGEWCLNNTYLKKENFHIFDKSNGVIVLESAEGERFCSSTRNIYYASTKDSGLSWSNGKITCKGPIKKMSTFFSETGQVIINTIYLNEDDEEVVDVFQSKNFGKSFKKLK